MMEWCPGPESNRHRVALVQYSAEFFNGTAGSY